MRLLLNALLLICALCLSNPAVSGDDTGDARISALVVSDAVTRLAAKEMDYESGEYNILRKAGFSDTEIREFIRPILEKSGFSENDIVRYFNLFDPNYHGGEAKRIESHEEIVDNLLN